MDEYIPDNEVEKYFDASDIVAISYESATQSGIAQLAYEFEKPIVVTGYIIPSKNLNSLSEAIIRFFKKKIETLDFSRRLLALVTICACDVLALVIESKRDFSSAERIRCFAFDMIYTLHNSVKIVYYKFHYWSI